MKIGKIPANDGELFNIYFRTIESEDKTVIGENVEIFNEMLKIDDSQITNKIGFLAINQLGHPYQLNYLVPYPIITSNVCVDNSIVATLIENCNG